MEYKVAKELLVEKCASFPDTLHFQIGVFHFNCDESPKCVKIYSCLLQMVSVNPFLIVITICVKIM